MKLQLASGETAPIVLPEPLPVAQDLVTLTQPNIVFYEIQYLHCLYVKKYKRWDYAFIIHQSTTYHVACVWNSLLSIVQPDLLLIQEGYAYKNHSHCKT